MRLGITLPGSRRRTKGPSTLASVDEEIERARARLSRKPLVFPASARRQRAARLRSLLRLRYTLLPVGRLPPELLSAVLEAARLACEPWHERPRTLLGLSHVCGTRREAAHASPNLWSSLDFRCPPLARYSLDRGPTVPLDVFCPYVESTHLLERVLLLMHRSRTVELILDPDEDDILEELKDRFTQTYAPYLHPLTLVAERPFGVNLIEFNPAIDLLSHEAIPNLKVLRLDRVETG
jgi:hypothetical protein